MKMKVCALCNGVVRKEIDCSKCGSKLTDKGRVYDFFDDYSAYMDIDEIKLADGIPDSSGSDDCLHLFSGDCGHDETWVIKFMEI
ncbi:hypothetical protein [Rossellomorea aquimaris]|uniref:Uncharacterized protein n=1 Tax=Rossellomorea aquimaris TaxID=189382 RepID=A0A5D4U7L7_9BACI|nr:hypothetical protein [Rossellomorea aquimaris]TYS83243.1 hypothetical protein FZC80_02630 [Rossellomorea aquimaris]